MIAIAAILLIQELVAIRREQRGQAADHAMAPSRVAIPRPIW